MTPDDAYKLMSNLRHLASEWRTDATLRRCADEFEHQVKYETDHILNFPRVQP